MELLRFLCTSTIQRIKQLVSKSRPHFSFLSETLTRVEVSKKLTKAGFVNCIGMDVIGRSGGYFLASLVIL